MPVYTYDQLVQFHMRWNDKEQLISEVLRILRGPGKSEEAGEVRDKLEIANQLLTINGFPAVQSGVVLWVGNYWVKVPALDLRGVSFPDENYKGINLAVCHLEGAILNAAYVQEELFKKHPAMRYANVYFPGGTTLKGTHLENAILTEAHLEFAIMDSARLEGADLTLAHLNMANLRYAHLEGANLNEAFLQNAYMESSHLEGANFDRARIEGANFSQSTVGLLSREKFAGDCKLTDDEKTELSINRPRTFFYENEFLPRWRDHFFEVAEFKFFDFRSNKKDDLKLIKIPNIHFHLQKRRKIEWLNLRRHLFNRWFYSYFEEVRIEDADTTMAKDLYRYVQDQQFLVRFEERHPVLSFLWRLLSDFGGKLSVVFFWSMVFVGLFALLYSALGCIDPQPLEKLRGFWKWIFVSFDIFSNLGIRNTYPLNSLGVILMICESLMGFMMLGMLISVLQNRFARRS